MERFAKKVKLLTFFEMRFILDVGQVSEHTSGHWLIFSKISQSHFIYKLLQIFTVL